MSVAQQRDFGKLCKPVYSKAATTVDSEVDGDWIDRTAQGALFLSAKLQITFLATLASGETLTVAANFQDATDASGTAAADFGTGYTAAVVATGPSGGGAVGGVVTLDVNLSGARLGLRSQQTLTTSSTGTAIWAATILFGGADKTPAS